jgi:hypothetical protein
MSNVVTLSNSRSEIRKCRRRTQRSIPRSVKLKSEPATKKPRLLCRGEKRNASGFAAAAAITPKQSTIPNILGITRAGISRFRQRICYTTVALPLERGPGPPPLGYPPDGGPGSAIVIRSTQLRRNSGRKLTAVHPSEACSPGRISVRTD